MDNVELVQAAAELQPSTRTNWATNIAYSTPVLHEVSSVAEIQSLVQSSQQITTAGTGHSFNFIADSLYARLSLRHLHQVLGLDAFAGTVTLAAGMKYDQLCKYLHSRGFALHNLASLTELSIAGAVSTGAHGSGDANGGLGTAVAAVELAGADGELIHFDRHTNGDIFHGVVVGLGALGIITKLTLKIEPAFIVRQFVYEDLPLKELTENFSAIMSAGYTVSLFTDWQHQNFYQLWIKIREGDPGFGDRAPEFFHGAKLQTQNLNMVRGMDPIHCTEQRGIPGPWHERLPHFKPGFMPGVGDELQSEYFVPRRHAIAAILAVERLRDRVTPLLLESEIRTVAADQLWMSPCFGRDSVAIHFCWKNEWDAVRRLLPVIERELAAFDPRPHWGKLFAMAPEAVQAKYEKVEAFRNLARRLDPSAKFRNPFLNTYVFSSQGSATSN